jgi:hypothetical protein
MKNKILIILILLVILSGVSYADVNTTNIVDLIVDGEKFNTLDVEQGVNTPAFIYNSRTMMPLKMTFEIFGIPSSSIRWNAVERSVTVQTNDGNIIWMQIDNPTIKYNNQEMTFDVPAKIYSNRTYVPIAMISSLLDEVIKWDGETRSVHLNPGTYFIKAFDMQFYLKPSMGYQKPNRIGSEQSYVLSNYNTNYGNILIEHKESTMPEVMSNVADLMEITTEEFILFNSNYESYYYKNDRFTVVLLLFKDEVYLFSFSKFDLDEIEMILISMKEVN